MRDYPKFSVVTPSYNQGRFIRRTIDSVLEQNYPNFEHIVIDGGSTDETVDILKSYPHLKWVSERDNGQTDALNKGFARATGDVIACINSDDWYAPGAFEAVRESVRSYPVVVGHCEITTGDGRPTEHIVNYKRDWFDLIKYWVPYSIPTQPSMFFTRVVLEEMKLENGLYLDEGLNFCMDYEFWLRVFQKYEFRKVERLLSYYRMYEDNKTGTGMDPLRPEMSRVFRRSERRGQAFEQTFSVVLPADRLTSALEESIRSFESAAFSDSEIVIVGFGGNDADIKALKRMVREKQGSAARIRFIGTGAGSAETAFLSAAPSCYSLYLVCAEPGTAFSRDLTDRLLLSYADDQTSCVLPASRPEEAGALLLGAGGQFELDRSFALPNAPLNFSVRRLAFNDLKNVLVAGSPAALLRSCVLGSLFKGWKPAFEKSELFLSSPGGQTAVEEPLSEKINAEIILALRTALLDNEFAQHRLRMGASLILPDALVDEAKRVLKL